MAKFSKLTIQKLKSHLEKLKNSTNEYKQNHPELKDKKFHQSKIFIKNRNVAKALLVESVFLNLKILSYTRSSFLIRFILNTKKAFVDKELTNNSYLLIKLPKTDTRLKNLEASLNLIIKNLIQISRYEITKIEKSLILIKNIFNHYYELLKRCIKRWYVYLNRFFVLTLIHFIPFIQITTKLFYTYPNPILANPITSNLFQVFPLLLCLLNTTGKYFNNDSFSFLLLGLYYKIFIISYKTYKIPKKIAFQGAFAIALILLNYCVTLSTEITTLIYKFAKRFFFYTKSQNIDLLRDDMNFFVDDLEQLRYFKETYLQLGESIFLINDLHKVIKISESVTIVSLIAVIALLYNYVYFILRGEKPIIPVVTKTVRRLMVDRNGDEL